MIEERELGESQGEPVEIVRATYVYSDVLDDGVQMRRPSGGAYPAGEYFFHQDDQGNVLLVTDSSGTPVERYEYNDFGYPTIIDPSSGQPRATSLIGNRFLFTGREWDADTRLYHYRFRDYDPSTGRFLQRDPLGVWGDLANLGNATAYVGNNPWTYTDPYGLITPTIEALRDPSAYNEPWDRAVQEDYFDGGYTGIGAPASYMVPDLYFEKLGAGCNVGGGMGGRGGIGAPGLSPAPSGAGGVQAAVPPAKISCSRPQCGGYRSGVANTGVGKPASGATAQPSIHPVGFGNPSSVSAKPPTTSASGYFRNGETPATAAGRRAHQNYKNALGDGYDVEVRLPSGRRGDAVDWEHRVVRELKPDNPKAIGRGVKQVEQYRQELEALTGEKWQCEVDTYKP